MQICFLEEYDFIGPNGIKSLVEPRRGGSLIQQSTYIQPLELWQVGERVGTPPLAPWLRAGGGAAGRSSLVARLLPFTPQFTPPIFRGGSELRPRITGTNVCR